VADLERELIAHAPDAITFSDCAGVIRLWNHGAETLFGHGAEEAIGLTLDLIVPEPRTGLDSFVPFSKAALRKTMSC
jgi:PAS domain S-box-containing protein